MLPMSMRVNYNRQGYYISYQLLLDGDIIEYCLVATGSHQYQQMNCHLQAPYQVLSHYNSG